MLKASKYLIRQKVELIELLGFETRNKYQVLDETGQLAYYVAEQNKSLLGMLGRQFFGHVQKLNLFVFDANRQKVLEIKHPYSFFFQRIRVHGADGALIGECIHRFGFFRRRVDILDANGAELMQIRSPLSFFRAWDYPVYQDSQMVARIRKKLSGIMKEMFTDADNFTLSFQEGNLSEAHRSLVFGAVLLIDLLFFETKASR